MNLFWKRLFGGLEKTAKTEAYYQYLVEAHKRYRNVAKSKELADYKTLFETVKSPDFKEKKKTLINRKYKDTQESRDMHAFKRYSADSKLKLYYTTLESAELKEYLSFKKTADYSKLGSPAEVKKSPELTRLKSFERSNAYKNYVRFHDSYVVKEYERLKERVSTPEFKKENAFWEDSRRWEKTEECALEQRYFALADNPDIIFYQKTDPKQFSQLDILHLAFRDEFDWNTLNTTNWKPGFHYPNPKMKAIHSFGNEKQANMGGNNISVESGHLVLSTRHETRTALAWDEAKGFVNKEYKFTSDVLQGRHTIYQKSGLFRAKMRFEGSDLKQAFWIKGENKLPHVNICVCDGKSIEVGVYWKSSAGVQYTSRKITGINPSEFYLYTLIWTPRQLVWYINNLEVFRTTDGVPSELMYPMFSSFIPETMKGGTGRLEVDWIEVYAKK